MYTFHATEEDARTTYEEVLQAYENVLNRLQLDFVKGICKWNYSDFVRLICLNNCDIWVFLSLKDFGVSVILQIIWIKFIGSFLAPEYKNSVYSLLSYNVFSVRKKVLLWYLKHESSNSWSRHRFNWRFPITWVSPKMPRYRGGHCVHL